jgi:hypothetical protein
MVIELWLLWAGDDAYPLDDLLLAHKTLDKTCRAGERVAGTIQLNLRRLGGFQGAEVKRK